MARAVHRRQAALVSLLLPAAIAGAPAASVTLGCGLAADGGLDGGAFGSNLNLIQGYALARPTSTNASQAFAPLDWQPHAAVRPAPARTAVAPALGARPSLPARIATAPALDVRASLGADGVPRIRLQAQPRRGELPPPADSVPGGAAVAARLRLRAENARLREENARLRAAGAALREGSSALRLQDAKLRSEDTELRLEDAKLRLALASANGVGEQEETVLAAGTMSQTDRKTTAIWGCALSLGILVLACIIHHSSQCFMGDDESGSDEEAEDKLLFDLDGHKKRSRYCSCCWCCCSPGVLAFLTVTLVASVVGGCILWQTGVLQPILAQFMTYAYVIALFAAFVTILVWEFWRTFRTFIKYIVTQLRGLKNLLRPFRRPVRQVDIFAN